MDAIPRVNLAIPEGDESIDAFMVGRLYTSSSPKYCSSTMNLKDFVENFAERAEMGIMDEQDPTF